MILGLLVVGCGEVENGAYKHRPKPADKNESTPTTNTNEVDGTTAKPVKELTLREKAIGTYEIKKDGDTYRVVLLETGIVEKYRNGKKHDEEDKWKIVDGEIHIIEGSGHMDVIRINKDGSITNIATIDKDGKREDAPKEDQVTIQKIK